LYKKNAPMYLLLIHVNIILFILYTNFYNYTNSVDIPIIFFIGLSDALCIYIFCSTYHSSIIHIPVNNPWHIASLCCAFVSRKNTLCQILIIYMSFIFSSQNFKNCFCWSKKSHYWKYLLVSIFKDKMFS